MYYAEACTNENGSNMGVTVYNDIPMDHIANDIIDTYKNDWDYVIVWDENDENICTIYREDEGYFIDWEESMERYIVRDSEAGNYIEGFDTKEQAFEAISAYEEDDKEEGSYTEGFYEVFDNVNKTIVKG